MKYQWTNTVGKNLEKDYKVLLANNLNKYK